jgi:lysophospholipase L1-like esterase
VDPAQESQFGFGKSVLFSAILIACFLGLAELGVRGWAYYLREDVEKFDLATQTFVLVPGTHRAGTGFATINSQGFVGKELKPDGPDLWRIAAVGDSCTFGGGHEKESYPAMLQGLLEKRERPGQRYEVVNAGISGLNSELALRRLRSKVLPLAPDIVTIYIGWNDLMKFDPIGQADGSRLAGVARVLDKLWLVKGLRKLLFFYLRPYARLPRTGAESRTGRFADFRPTFYEDNLREMIVAVRESGGEAVLVTLPTVVRRDMTVEDLRRARVVFPYFPSAYGVGDFLDLLAAYNASVHRVAREEGTPLIDLARAFEAIPDPVPYFLDTMHATARGLSTIARQLLLGLEREGLLGSDEPVHNAAPDRMGVPRREPRPEPSGAGA